MANNGPFSCTSKAALGFVSLGLGVSDSGRVTVQPRSLLLPGRLPQGFPCPAGSKRSKPWQWHSYGREGRRNMCVRVKERMLIADIFYCKGGKTP